MKLKASGVHQVNVYFLWNDPAEELYDPTEVKLHISHLRRAHGKPFVSKKVAEKVHLKVLNRTKG